MAYKDENYKQGEDVYSSLVQCFEDMKNAKIRSIGSTWNVAVESLKGITLKLVGDCHIQLTYTCFQMANPEILKDTHKDMKKFLDEVIKEMKKGFKSKTKTSIVFKKIQEHEGIEKYSQTFGAVSNASLGNGPRRASSVAGKYLLRCARVYEFSTSLQDD